LILDSAQSWNNISDCTHGALNNLNNLVHGKGAGIQDQVIIGGIIGFAVEISFYKEK